MAAVPLVTATACLAATSSEIRASNWLVTSPSFKKLLLRTPRTRSYSTGPVWGSHQGILRVIRNPCVGAAYSPVLKPELPRFGDFASGFDGSVHQRILSTAEIQSRPEQN